MFIGQSLLCFSSNYPANYSRGEPGAGTWTIIVKDTNVNEFNGTFTDWKLTLWGECIDSAKQSLRPMPTEHDDDNHDSISAVVSTTTLAAIPSATELPAQPSDHPDRPVNSKPGSSTSTSASGTVAESTSTPTSSTNSTSAATPSFTSTETFLPSYFPTFGVSKRTQIWIYGAMSVIILFCAGLGISFCVIRRRRARVNRADYEFEMLGDQEESGGNVSDGRRVKRRAGELYDAFAGESDEEIFSDVEGATEYKDEEPEEASTTKAKTGMSEK